MMSGARRAAERNAIERVICVLPLFHIFALTVILLRSLERGDLISLHQRFDVEAVMRDIEVKRATVFPGVPTMWIAIASLPDLDKPRSVVAGQLRIGRRAAAGRGRQDFRAQDQHEAQERLGHDRDLLARHRPSRRTGPDKPGSIGLMLPGIEMDVVALDDPTEGLAAGRSRRNPHQGTERHQGLLEPAAGNRRGLCRRPFPDRRYRLHGR